MKALGTADLRKDIPRWLKEDKHRKAKGLCECGCGKVCASIKGKDARFNHNPPLALRQINDDETDTIPASNDPHYIEMLTPDCDDKQTNGVKVKHGRAGGDRHAIDKVRRILNGGRKSKGSVPGSRDTGLKMRLGAGGRRFAERRAQ